MLRHFDQNERESDGSRHWEGIESVLLRKFERYDVPLPLWLKSYLGPSEHGSISPRVSLVL